MSTIQPYRTMNKYEANSSISFEHVSLWCPFLDPHLTTNHTNIGDITKSQVTKSSALTLVTSWY